MLSVYSVAFLGMRERVLFNIVCHVHGPVMIHEQSRRIPARSVFSMDIPMLAFCKAFSGISEFSSEDVVYLVVVGMT